MNRLRIVTVIALVLLSSTAARAQEGENTAIAPGIAFTPKGVIVIDDVLMGEVGHFNPVWGLTLQHQSFRPSADPQVSDTSFAVDGKMKTTEGPMQISQQAVASDDGVHYAVKVHNETWTKTGPYQTNLLVVRFLLPVEFYQGRQLLVDGEPVTLPQEQIDEMLKEATPAQQIEMPTPNGTLTITGDFEVSMQDNRQWNENVYAMRVTFTPASGDITDSRIDLLLNWQESDQAAASDDAAESADAPDAAEADAAE